MLVHNETARKARASDRLTKRSTGDSRGMIEHPVRKRVVSATIILGFWAIAAWAITVIERSVGPQAPRWATALSLSVLVFISYGYERLVSRGRGLTHAIIVGTTWLSLSIAAELVVTGRIGSGWYSILGSPEEGLLRMIRMVAWIFTPTLFARGQ